jgi:murein DD-endopeptidase MepM/ murein hydrolase activator NlpD
MLAAFAIGFALGMVCLGAVLYGTGQLRMRLPGAAAAWRQEAPPVPDQTLSKLDEGVKQIPKPELAPPADLPVEPAGPNGTADRSIAPGATPPHLAMPLAGVDPKSLTSNFSDTRDGHQHEALDIMASRGTPVLAVAEGNVAKLFTSKQGGLTVYQFDNTGNWCFYYAHLDRYAPGLKEGTLLRKGDTLGYVGTTGDAPPDAPHLHFAVFRLGPEKHWWQGTAIDPLPLFK